ncbi:hypothetical protein CDD81_6151 [Ophiocordyceps australis]|uniref:Ribosomal protein S15 n=1 Tax=Ophiocordyceps australis TaxID=1399860 RepID=A0A2C5Y8L0_9HYPO|nr:hypothetical protein CDD81_6151 [Ophiocordyceps australis]
MPLRLEALQRLSRLQIRAISPKFLPLMQVASISQREKKRKAKLDPYKWAQAQQRKNANLERRQELEKQRSEEWGHSAWGKTTPFLESLDSAGQEKFTPIRKGPMDEILEKARPLPTTPGLRNHFLTDAEVNEAIQHAQILTRRIEPLVTVQKMGGNDSKGAGSSNMDKDLEQHLKAKIVIDRITALDHGTSRDRYRANVTRIINEFGRHKTDKFLKPKPKGILSNPRVEKPKRAGPDTGSSEVQIALLTAKIRNLSKALDINRGYRDKANKRNLRLLVHRRQKLLQYMQRSERGSERWTHMLEKLGLTPATWMGEITV